MKGVILEKGIEYYTDMNAMLEPIREDVAAYNWLVTDCECNHYPDSKTQFDAEYAWLSGEDLLASVDKHDIQFIWAVFSAFPKHVTLEDVLKHDRPYADGYTGFWNTPVGIQHPLAEIEIVSFDSSLVLVIAKDDALAARFQKQFPLSEDLEQYNTRGIT